ncbi:hypothetical protein V8E53_006875 [Lactarius tabidus]
MGQISLNTENPLTTGFDDLTWALQHHICMFYVACFYDWIISLDQEIAFIHPAPWNAVKCAYLFCRYYPLAIAPFHFWGFMGDHEKRVCESYYPALYYCTIPMILSAQFILMLRTYAFSGKKKWVLAVLSITLLVLLGVTIWVMSKELSLTLLFVLVDRTACFALSDQPTINSTGSILVRDPIDYHLGIISIIAAFFDFLNMFIVVQRCIRERGTLGPLSQSFLKQGIVVYVIMTASNVLSIGCLYSPQLLHDFQSIGPAFAYILPSALSCRLVLMLRRKASPTETELHFEHSHMINEALEMIDVIPKNFIPSTSTDVQGQP